MFRVKFQRTISIKVWKIACRLRIYMCTGYIYKTKNFEAYRKEEIIIIEDENP